MSLDYEIGPFHLDTGARVMTFAGAPVALGSRAVAVLTALVERPDQFVEKARILDAARPGLVVEEAWCCGTSPSFPAASRWKRAWRWPRTRRSARPASWTTWPTSCFARSSSRRGTIAARATDGSKRRERTMEKLAAADEIDATRRRHARHVRDRFERA
jgi:hypothetical protein